jgi:hypothetical protein
VNNVRQQLRRAAQDFADQVYEALRADILADLRRELALDAARRRDAQPKPPVRLSRAQRSSSTTPLERVLIYVTEHPGTAPKAIIEATGMGRPAVFAALASACSMGALVKEGTWRNVTYSPAGHMATEEPAVDAGTTLKPRRSRIGAADIVGDVVAWIAAHPGCRRSELTTAFPVTSGVLRRALDVARHQRRIEMEGTRASAHYFAVHAPTGRARGASGEGLSLHRGDAMTSPSFVGE